MRGVLLRMQAQVVLLAGEKDIPFSYSSDFGEGLLLAWNIPQVSSGVGNSSFYGFGKSEKFDQQFVKRGIDMIFSNIGKAKWVIFWLIIWINHFIILFINI